MKALVLYDSVYGNTEKIARAVGSHVSRETVVARTGKLELPAFKEFDVIVVGSPTHGGRPTKAVKNFLAGVPASALKGKRAAAFDTRVSKEGQGAFVRGIINFFGYAAPRIAKELEKKGAIVIARPEGFLVKGKDGPLEEGELERAAEWAESLKSK